MRTGWYRAVHVKSLACRSWRALLTARRMVLNKRRDVENGLRALLREVGLKVGTPSRKDFPARVRDLASAAPVLANLAESLLSVIEVMTQEVDRLTKRVLDTVRVEPTCRRLMTVPGVGPLTALAFRAPTGLALIDAPCHNSELSGKFNRIGHCRRRVTINHQPGPPRKRWRCSPSPPVNRWRHFGQD